MIVSALLKAGARTDIVNSYGDTPGRVLWHYYNENKLVPGPSITGKPGRAIDRDFTKKALTDCKLSLSYSSIILTVVILVGWTSSLALPMCSLCEEPWSL